MPEQPVAPIAIVKRGRRPSEHFSPDKLHASIVLTCLSLRTPEGQAEEIARSVTLAVMDWCRERPEITSDDLRRQAGKRLRALHADAAFLYNHHKTML